MVKFLGWGMTVLLLLFTACGEPKGESRIVNEALDSVDEIHCLYAGTENATAGCLEPTFPPEYYVAEALAYFDTLDTSADRDSIPNYHPEVARWEWPPWLLLTGFGADEMNLTADTLRVIDPSTVPERDCRFFQTQPFARCYVVFEYRHGPCPIYEEFSFDADGRMTFIEAWSVFPWALPLKDGDTWAEATDFFRLATVVPGLGSSTGYTDFEGSVFQAIAATDPLMADYGMRASNWRLHWRRYLDRIAPDFFDLGCGWSTL